MMIKVVFVCLGNICRSPMAEAIFRHKVKEAGLDGKILVESRGTSDWHIGKRPHEGTLDILDKYKISSEGMAASQYQKADLTEFDYIVAMDNSNVENIELVNEVKDSEKVFLLLDLLEDVASKDVPDPYFTGDFDETYNLVTRGSEALIEKIKSEHHLV